CTTGTRSARESESTAWTRLSSDPFLVRVRAPGERLTGPADCRYRPPADRGWIDRRRRLAGGRGPSRDSSAARPGSRAGSGRRAGRRTRPYRAFWSLWAGTRREATRRAHAG